MMRSLATCQLIEQAGRAYRFGDGSGQPVDRNATDACAYVSVDCEASAASAMTEATARG